jgi:hypothetical protein
MSAWRRVAIEKIPRYRRLIAESDNIYCLWSDLFDKFRKAHLEPTDEELIRQVYDYGWWCVDSRGWDSSNAGIVSFFEELPRFPEVRAQLPKWLTPEAFNGMKEIFRYHLRSDKEYEAFIREFYEPEGRLRREEQIHADLFIFEAEALGKAGTLTDRQARWSSLLAKVGGEAGIQEINPDLAARLLGCGWTLAMARTEYSEAARLTELFFQHPALRSAAPPSRVDMSCRRAASLLYLGRTDEAAHLYRSLIEDLKDRPAHAHGAAISMWGHLNEYCASQPGKKTAPEALAKLVYEVASRMSGRIRRAAPRYEPREGASYSELLALLTATLQTR